MQKIRILSYSMMATLVLMSFSPIQFSAAKSRAHASNPLTAASIKWENDLHDFGEIPQSVPVSVEFAFTNTGDEPLIIKEVLTSCGCTASNYAKEPIMPGKSSTIKVSYNAANAGSFSKTITVNSNDKNASKVLLIKGFVKSV